MISIFYFLFILFSFLLFTQGHGKIVKPLTQHQSLLYIAHGLDYIEGSQSKTQKLIQAKLYSTRSRYYQKDRTKKNGKDRSCDCDTIPGHLPKLGSCQGECPYPCDYVSIVGEEGGGDG